MKTKAKRHDITLTPKGDILNQPTAAGVDRIRFRADIARGDKIVERTVLAQGRAAKAIAGMIKSGKAVTLTGVFARMPVIPAGETAKPAAGETVRRRLGAEYVAITGLPQAA